MTLVLRGGGEVRFTDDESEDANDDASDDEPVELAQRCVDLFESGLSHVHAGRESFAAVVIAKNGAFTAGNAGFEFSRFMTHAVRVKSNLHYGKKGRMKDHLATQPVFPVPDSLT